jgi:hypothetical protein
MAVEFGPQFGHLPVNEPEARPSSACLLKELFKVIAVKHPWNEGTRMDVLHASRAATVRMFVAPAQKMLGILCVGAHLSSRNIKEVARVFGGVRYAPGKPLSFFYECH